MGAIFATGWVEQDSQSAAIATATRAARSGESHVIFSVSASYSATKIGLLQIKDASTVIWEHYIYNAEPVTFPAGIEITAGAACSAVFASGGGSIVGKVNLTGITR